MKHCWILCCFFIFSIFAQNTKETLEWQITRAKQSIYCWNLIHGLQLTPKQKGQLYQLANQVKKINAKYHQHEASHLIVFERLLLKFRDQAAINQGYAKSLEKKVAAANRYGNDLQKEYFGKINFLENKAQKILNPEQLFKVKNYRPSLSSNSFGNSSDSLNLLLQIRKLSQKEFERKAPKYLSRYLKKIEKNGQKIDDNRLWRLLILARNLPEQDFQRNAKKLAEQFMPVNSARKARKELKRIHKETKGEMGNTAKYLLSPQSIVYYQKKFQKPKNVYNVKVEKLLFSYRRDIQKLRKEVDFYNLINGLHLSKNQIRDILALARKREKLQKRFTGGKKQRSISSLQSELQLLQKMQKLALQGKTIGKWVEKEHRTIVSGKNVRYSTDHYKQACKNIEHQTQNTLSEGQQQVLADFKPCLVPPKNLKNPVRAGQVENNDHLVRLLSRLRNTARKKSYYQPDYRKYFEKVEKHQGKLNSSERELLTSRWNQVLTEAIEMSDEEFEISKEELADQLKMPDKKTHLKKIIQQQAESEKLPGKTAHFLLAPEVIPLLQNRLKQKLLAQHRHKTDLSKIKKAENCEDGHCALED